MRRCVRAPLIGLLVTCGPFLSTRAEDAVETPYPAEREPLGLVFGFRNVGLGLGNVPRLTGLRLNLVDALVEEVNGINLSILGSMGEWSPKSKVRGLSYGGVLGVGEFSGVALSPLLVDCYSRMDGLAVSFGVVSCPKLRGLTLAPFTVAGRKFVDRPSDPNYDQVERFGEILFGPLAMPEQPQVSGFTPGHITGVTLGLVVGARDQKRKDGDVQKRASMGGISIAGANRCDGVVRGAYVDLVLEGTQFRGIHLSPFGATLVEDFRGVNVSGILEAKSGNFRGISLAGAMICEGDARGFLVNTYMRCGDFTGINLSGFDFLWYLFLGTGVEARHFRGLNIASWTDLAELTGVSLSALLNTWESQMNGATLAGIFNRGRTQKGINIAAGFNLLDERSQGLMFGGVFNRAAQLDGVACAGIFNYVPERQSGISLAGLFNFSKELHGIQLGLLNYAGNNPSGLRLLPFLNCHF